MDIRAIADIQRTNKSYNGTVHWLDRASLGGSVVKNPPSNGEDTGLIPELGRSPGEGNDNPLEYSCLGNPMDRRAWWATIPEVTKGSDMT